MLLHYLTQRGALSCAVLVQWLTWTGCVKIRHNLLLARVPLLRPSHFARGSKIFFGFEVYGTQPFHLLFQLPPAALPTLSPLFLPFPLLPCLLSCPFSTLQLGCISSALSRCLATEHPYFDFSSQGVGTKGNKGNKYALLIAIDGAGPT